MDHRAGADSTDSGSPYIIKRRCRQAFSAEKSGKAAAVREGTDEDGSFLYGIHLQNTGKWGCSRRIWRLAEESEI